MDPKYDQKYDDKFFSMKAKLDGHKNNPAMNYRPKRTGDKGDDANNRSFIDREGCFKTRAKGFVGPAFQMAAWKKQSDVVPADHPSVRKGRGTRGISECKGRKDFKLQCDPPAGLSDKERVERMMIEWLEMNRILDPPETQG